MRRCNQKWIQNEGFTIHTEDTQAEGLLSGTYDYSIEKDTLTLTEREYGDQLVFVKREKK